MIDTHLHVLEYDILRYYASELPSTDCMHYAKKCINSTWTRERGYADMTSYRRTRWAWEAGKRGSSESECTRLLGTLSG